MINPNVLYNVTGRYMDGQNLVAYHLVGEDGSQSQESKERVIFLIGKGIISNMRIQVGKDKEVIIRGKGVNLNTLPVFDIKKQKFRDDDVSQAVANSGVNVSKKVADVNPMGQYRLLRRITYKNQTIGYEVQDYSGAVTRKKKEQVIELAVQRLISNAIAQKTIDKNNMQTKISLRGVDCELKKLPILIVTEQGKIVDPKADNSKLTMRSIYLKHAGILRDNVTQEYKQFNAGDFIICYPDGAIDIKSRIYVEKYYVQDHERKQATCDDYLENCSNYSIEIFGSKPVRLSDKMIKSWAIVKKKEEKVG